MNYIILFGAGYIQKIDMKSYKLIISSILGAMYAILSYLHIIPIYSSIFMKILLSIIMIYTAYNPPNVKKMCKELILFYLVSFVIGGCAWALLYLISPQNVAYKDGVLIGTYPMKITIIAGIIGFIIIQYSFNTNKRMMRKKDLICDLEIEINEQIITTKAYIDSGNTLKDPLTKTPVIIIEKEILKDIFKEDKNIENKTEKIRFIPFKSIGKQNGMLIAIKPKCVRIIQEDAETINIKNILLGIYDKKINKDFSALIGLDLLERRENYGHNRNTKQVL